MVVCLALAPVLRAPQPAAAYPTTSSLQCLPLTRLDSLNPHPLITLLLRQGLLPNYVKVVPSIAIAFVSYEKLKETMGVELRISS